MAAQRGKIILWTGPKHSGKSTAAGELVARARRLGFVVAGLLAERRMHNGKFAYEGVDLGTGDRTVLAEAGTGNRGEPAFVLTAQGLAFGRTVLNGAASADLVIVDEFGPLEMDGGGWRGEVDRLLNKSSAKIVLVVRKEIADQIPRLYGRRCCVVEAASPTAIEEVLQSV